MQTKQPLCVLIYDGDCAFCRSQVQRIQRWDSDHQFEFVPSQDATLISRFPVLADQDFQTGMRLITHDGRVRVGADAVYEILRRIWPAKYAAWLYRIPGASLAAKAAYAVIAKNRHRLGARCPDGACQVASKT